ncbi:T9SS type B sorting domain-containing protein [Chitinophaga parva]|nr:gliding motility-associated C-terminal domain-containing protein [Chitinophaga parva]
MKRLRTIFAILLGFIPYCAVAQKQSNNWFFGDHAAITFNNGAPQAVSGSAMQQREGCASISDPSGNLMFYTDGITVWNASNQPMPNGTGLGGEDIATQSAVIVPLPQSKTLYYLFTVDDWQNDSGSFQYSIVDMSKDGGKGDVVTKNVLINSKVREQVTSVYSGSNCNVWIITHEKGNNNFDAYLLSDAGLQPTPVVSSVGMVYQGTNRYGYLKFSPNGKKLAAELGHPDITSDITIQLFDFDNQTGIVSNAVTVATGNQLFDAYSLEFSPSGNVLYATASYGNATLYQFDLSSGISSTIEASVKNVGNGYEGKTCVQLAPDKKIYVSKDGYQFLGCVNNPDVVGTGCNYVNNAVDLGSGRGRLGFPNFVQSFFLYPSLGKKEYDLCEGEKLDVDVTTAAGVTYEWQDGTTGPKYSITKSGQYWVKATFDNCTRYDTTVANFTPLPIVDLGADTTLCNGASLQLDAKNPGATFLWQDNSISPTYAVSSAGTYSVTVTKDKCSASDNIKVDYAPGFTLDLGKDTNLCAGQPLKLQPVYTGTATFLWQDGSTADNFDVPGAGKFWLRETRSGCAVSDTINVAVIAYPVVSLGNDTTLCEGSELLLDATNTGVTYAWQDGTTAATYSVISAGTYSVTANRSGCKTTDDINVIYNPLPVVDLGKDTSLCEGLPLVLQTAYTGSPDFLWQDGSTADNFNVSGAGKYWLRETLNGCANSDTVLVATVAYPVVDFGPDTTLCEGNTLLLNAAATGVTYRWQDGSSNASYTVSSAGTYSVTANRQGCKTTVAINVSYSALPVVDLGQDATYCTVQPVVLDASASGGASFLWQDGSTASTFTVGQTGKYWVQVLNNFGCANADTVRITYDLSTDGKSQLEHMCMNEPFVLDAGIFTSTPATYRWQDGSTTQQLVVRQPGHYIVEVTTACKTVKDTILLGVRDCSCKLEIPNAFSPNGDGHNDIFMPNMSYCAFKTYHLSVYNRWGNLLFESNDPGMGWNGTFKGSLADVATYVYVLQYQAMDDSSMQLRKGTVTLLR